MDTTPTTYQPCVRPESKHQEFGASATAAQNSNPSTFCGHSLSGNHPLTQKKLCHNQGADEGLKKIPDSGGQRPVASSKEVSEFRITKGNPAACLPGTKESFRKDNSLINIHFQAIGRITPPQEYFPKSNSNAPLNEQLADKTIHWLQHSNTPYDERGSVKTKHYLPVKAIGNNRLRPIPRRLRPPPLEENKNLGVFYPEDYQVRDLPDLINVSSLGFHSLPKYFDARCKSSFVATSNGQTPSECLSAFFHGPTTAGCATTMLACQYRAIETILGTDEFNRLFGSPVSTFRIACSIFCNSETMAQDACEDLSLPSGVLKPFDMINPLYGSLFGFFSFGEPISNPTGIEAGDLDIKKGDIVYIQGVKSYSAKHKTGSAIGFNLICTGQNSSEQNLYLGFGPDDFAEPKTFEQVKNLLIDGYNQPQSTDTIAAIKKGETGYADWTDHTLSYTSPIVGLTCGIRFSPERWAHVFSNDKAWHQQLPLPVTPVLEPKPVDHIEPFPIENLVADFENFETGSSQQDQMKQTALKFTHAVINNLDETLPKQPMGLFLTGSAGIGKTHLCVAVAKKAAHYGVNTLYISDERAGSLYLDFGGDDKQWHRKVDEMLAGKDLVIVDDVTECQSGITKMFLAKTMKHVMAENKAIMVSSNYPVHIDKKYFGIIDPLTETAHNFCYLNDLRGDSRRSRWWDSLEVQTDDALLRLGHYQGDKAAGVITEQVESIDEIAIKLRIPVGQIRQVGPSFLPGGQKLMPDHHLSDLSKSEHQVVFLECDMTGSKANRKCKIEQFLNVIQRVHDEGLKLVVKTNDRLLFIEKVMNHYEDDFLAEQQKKIRTTDRLKNMFPDFS
ncbi:DnaA ATPase domain-containing protein [Endozoicomonas acroporae]|uniref:DnaA ATPase domain-containing protein n=1 Tax=Endozoicomonas acroporae TaxID=1701104 RepID=UPI000C79558E|nr:DnaA/Hda family protein [Endozoicomonas acroporae]